MFGGDATESQVHVRDGERSAPAVAGGAGVGAGAARADGELLSVEGTDAAAARGENTDLAMRLAELNRRFSSLGCS